METDKPLISILMAVYEPRLDWLKEQLYSLNAQTYPNLKLYIRDDCSPTVSFEAIKKLVSESITAFPYVIHRNSENRGSNTTFELLTKEADGEYFAYCDQDDIWLPEKLSILQQTIEAEDAALVCSDMYVIDENGKQIADSIVKIRRHHVFQSGADLAKTLWYSNFASGCALLVRSKLANLSIPFNPHMYYDHYIALWCANKGQIISLPDRLILHREHGENQSSTLQGVYDKRSYRRINIDQKAMAIKWLYYHFPCDDSFKKVLQEGVVWMCARQAYAYGEISRWKTIWKYRYLSPRTSFFEIAMPLIPNSLFRFLLWAKRENYL